MVFQRWGNNLIRNESPGKIEGRLAQMLSKIKGRAFRLTPQRLAILKILAASEEHPSVDEIYQEVRSNFPTTSVATVYKTIALLKELNEVLELGFPDGSNRYDGNRPYPHPHAICVKCRKILDPEIASLEEISEEMKLKTGYTISYHRLDFFGLCPECQRKT
jgi:Fur family peroxide stress response transcriptional regulator